MEVHNPKWVPNLKYIDTSCAQKCCSSLTLKVTVYANDTEGRKGELIIRVLSAGSPASLSDRPTLYLNKMCSITLVLWCLWGKNPSSHPHDYPLKLCTAIISLRLELQWGGKKNVSWAQDTAPLGAGSGSKSNQGGKDLEAKSGIIRTQVMWACLSPAVCKSLTPSLPLASQRSPSNI